MKYYKHILFILVIVCFSTIVSAQNAKLEELKLRLKNAKHDTIRVITLYKLAVHYNLIGDFKNAEAYAKKSIALANKIHFVRGSAGAYNNAGVVYFNKGNYPDALQSYLAALNYSKQADMFDVISQATMNIGIIYAVQKEYDKAIIYLNESSNILQKLKDTTALADLHNNMGCLYSEQGKYTEALKNHNIAMQLYETQGNKHNLAGVYDNLGEIYMKLSSDNNALEYFLKALKIGEETIDKYSQAYSENKIGSIYLRQGSNAKAIEYLNKSLANAKEIGSLDLAKEIYKNLYEAFNNSHNTDKALSNYKNYILYRDSVYNQENTRKIVQSQMQYDFNVKMAADSLRKLAETQKQKALDTQKSKYYRTIAIASTIALIIIIALIVVFTNNKQKLKNKLAVQQTRDTIARDLHDEIGSTLTSITYMSEFGKIANAKNDEENTVLMLDKITKTSSSLATLMNDIIWAVNPEKDGSQHLVLKMKWFVQELLQASNIQIQFDIKKELELWNFTIEQKKNLYLIFKETLNNAFKYAKCNNIEIGLNIENNILNMKIADNGIGFTPTGTSTGNGIRNIMKRAQNIGATIDIKSNEGKGTEVNLQLKL